MRSTRVAVSVLFSEPKIPQLECDSNRPIRAPMFQCSSASRKFLNWESHRDRPRRAPVSVLFSEPKIPQSMTRRIGRHDPNAFQCSSASRKFLNSCNSKRTYSPSLFQCSSASRKFLNFYHQICNYPNIGVSVLFSEPKIPQCPNRSDRRRRVLRFSALQRAENSSIPVRRKRRRNIASGFSALQRAENSSI